jgi:hypothetical protein
MKKLSEETKRKISISLKGRTPKNYSTLNSEYYNKKRSISVKNNENCKKTQFKKNDTRVTGKNNRLWKGENVCYYALHSWINRQLGKPTICMHCGEKKKRLQWANKSHEYKRDLEDWISLCVRCHKQYDKCRRDIKRFYSYSKSLTRLDNLVEIKGVEVKNPTGIN